MRFVIGCMTNGVCEKWIEYHLQFADLIFLRWEGSRSPPYHPKVVILEDLSTFTSSDQVHRQVDFIQHCLFECRHQSCNRFILLDDDEYLLINALDEIFSFDLPLWIPNTEAVLEESTLSIAYMKGLNDVFRSYKNGKMMVDPFSFPEPLGVHIYRTSVPPRNVSTSVVILHLESITFDKWRIKFRDYPIHQAVNFPFYMESMERVVNDRDGGYAFWKNQLTQKTSHMQHIPHYFLSFYLSR